MNQLQSKNLIHTRKCDGCRQDFSCNDLGYDFRTKEFHCFQCNHNRYIDEGPDNDPKCNGCHQRFPIDELGIDENTKEYLCIHCNHYRYSNIDKEDVPKLCDFCDTLCDSLDVGKCEEGNLNVCGECWIKSL